MAKRYISIMCIIAAFCLLVTSVSYAAEKETVGMKIKKFWQGLFKYSARTAEESADVIADTTKQGTDVVATEIKRTGEVTSGDVAKTKELVVEPLTGATKTVKDAVEQTIKIPVEAAQEDQK